MIGRGPQIADAVVAELVDPARAWNSSSVMAATRKWLPVYSDGALKTLKVAVFALTLATTRPARGKLQEAYGVAIDFQKSVTLAGGVVVDAEVDALDLIAQQVYDYFNAVGTGNAFQFQADSKTWNVMQADREDLYDLNRLLYTDHTWETLISLKVVGWAT